MPAWLARKYRSELDEVIGQPWCVVDPENPGDDVESADIALLSRATYGPSTRTNLTLPTERFFKAVSRAKGLKWLHVFASGADNPLFLAVLDRGARLSSSVGAAGPTVALTAFTGLLVLSRGMLKWIDGKNRKVWQPAVGEHAPPSLSSQTAVVVGTGVIGREFARLCQSVGLTCIGVRRTPEPMEPFAECITLAQLDTALPNADWLVIACPLTAETKHLLNASRLDRLPASSYLINVARGEVVVEQDLVDTLTRGGIAGAYLDVFEAEPLPTHSPLWDMPQVLISPHNAAANRDLDDRVMDIFLQNLKRYLSGEPLRNEVSLPLR